jgi:aconitase A
MQVDYFQARSMLAVGKKEYLVYCLGKLEQLQLTDLKRLPFSIRVLLEAAVRQCNGRERSEEHTSELQSHPVYLPISYADRKSTRLNSSHIRY